MLDASAYEENSLTEWEAALPLHVLANGLGLPGDVLDALPKDKVDIAVPR